MTAILPNATRGFRRWGRVFTIVVDTNGLIELFLPMRNAIAVQDWRSADKDWRFPSLWICEFRHIHLNYLRAGLLSLDDAIEHLLAAQRLFFPQTVSVDSAEALRLAHQVGCSRDDAEFVMLAQQLACPLQTFDQKLLQLFPNLAVRSVA